MHAIQTTALFMACLGVVWIAVTLAAAIIFANKGGTNALQD